MAAAYEVNNTSGTVPAERTRAHPARPETASVTAGPRRAANIAHPTARRNEGMRRGRAVSASRMFRAGNSYRALNTPVGRPTSSDTTATSTATAAPLRRAPPNVAPTKAVAEFGETAERHKSGTAGSTATKRSVVTPRVRHLPGRSSHKQDVIPTGSSLAHRYPTGLLLTMLIHPLLQISPGQRL